MSPCASGSCGCCVGLPGGRGEGGKGREEEGWADISGSEEREGAREGGKPRAHQRLLLENIRIPLPPSPLPPSLPPSLPTSSRPSAPLAMAEGMVS